MNPFVLMGYIIGWTVVTFLVVLLVLFLTFLVIETVKVCRAHWRRIVLFKGHRRD